MAISSAAVACSGVFIAYSRRNTARWVTAGGLVLALMWMFNGPIVDVQPRRTSSRQFEPLHAPAGEVRTGESYSENKSISLTPFSCLILGADSAGMSEWAQARHWDLSATRRAFLSATTANSIATNVRACDEAVSVRFSTSSTSRSG